MKQPAPKHIAIIMDGNGRWAALRGKPRVFGHVRGAARVKPIVKAASDLGVQALTLFAFSTENWTRPPEEVRALWTLFSKYIRKEGHELHRRGVRFRVIGETERMDPEAREVLLPFEELTQHNTGLKLSVALSYGARAEILQAARGFAQACVEGRAQPQELDVERFQSYLWTGELGPLSDVDLVIRTSGEQRVSNFLLWQAAYAEYVFLPTHWPDFNADTLKLAIAEYEKRERRFGAVPSQSRQKANSNGVHVVSQFSP